MIDVLIPFYNREKYLPEALQSIESQTNQNWRVIFYDDGSTDGSVDVAKRFQEKYPKTIILSEKVNRGIGYARNRLLEAIEAPFAAFMDSDDISEPRRFQLQQDFLIQTNFDLVQTNMIYCKHGLRGCYERKIDIRKWRTGKPEDMWRNVCFASSFFRKHCQVVKFDEAKTDGGEDVKWLRTLVDSGYNVGHVPKPLYKIRNHPNRLTIKRQKRMKGKTPIQQFMEITK